MLDAEPRSVAERRDRDLARVPIVETDERHVLVHARDDLFAQEASVRLAARGEHGGVRPAPARIDLGATRRACGPVEEVRPDDEVRRQLDGEAGPEARLAAVSLQAEERLPVPENGAASGHGISYHGAHDVVGRDD